jgi:hypothetical protein
MENDKYQLTDLLSAAVEQKATNFSDAFNSLVLDRIHDAVENKKIEIAQQMYGYEANNSEE